MSYKNMRKSLIFVSLGCGLLMTAAGAQAPSNAQPQKGAKAEEKAEKKAEKAEEKAEKAELSSTPAPTSTPTSSNACFLWKGRGGAPTASYMATHASCRPWGSNQGWVFMKNANGVGYYHGTLKDAVATPSIWAVYADFSSAVFSTKAEYDGFVANTKLSGSCADCLR